MGIGAIVYGLLKFNRKRDIQFDPNTAFNLEGDTGMRIQYAYARMYSLLECQDIRDQTYIDFCELDKDLELRIALHLDDFSDAVRAVAEDYNPAHLANYTKKLVDLFNEYYNTVKVVVPDHARRTARLYFVQQVSKTLKKCMELLGIPTVPVIERNNS